MSLKYCSKCKKDRNASGFFSLSGKPTKRCRMCLETTRRAEAKRGKRKRDYKKYESQPHVKQRHKQWAKDNPEKNKEYYIRYRNNKREEDERGYLDHNAAVALDWRRRNPDKVDAQSKRNKRNPNIKTGTYNREPLKKGVRNDLTDAQMKQLFEQNCWYCGRMDSRGLCGIDRIDSSKHYTMDNVVAACKMCNYMKGEWTQESFVALCGHIATYNHWGYCHLIFDRLPDRSSISYSRSKSSAKDRDYDYDIDKDTYNFIRRHRCYLCGKCNSDTHINGVDRVCNEEGYTIDNCESCCSTCNYMKNHYELNAFLNKCVQIFDHSKNKVVFQKGKLQVCTKNHK